MAIRTSASGGGSVAGPSELAPSSFNPSQQDAEDQVHYQKNVTFGQWSLLTAVSTNIAARVRIYKSSAQQEADVDREQEVDPTGDHGVMLDYVSTGEALFDLAPGIVASSDSSSVYVTITNLSGATADLDVGIYGTIVYTGVPRTVNSMMNEMSAWFDASDIESIADTGGYVTALNDLSGRNNNLSQTGTYGPITGTRTQNGLNVLDFFDTTRSALYSEAFVQAQPCTIFVVAQTDSLTVDSFGRSCIIGWSGVTGYEGCGISQAGAAGQMQLYAGGAFYTYNTLAANTATQLTAVFDTSVARLYKEGVVGADLPPGDDGWGNGSRLMLGSAVDENVAGKFSMPAAWNGWIGEIIIFDGLMSTADRLIVETYLKDKWATGEAE